MPDGGSMMDAATFEGVGGRIRDDAIIADKKQVREPLLAHQIGHRRAKLDTGCHHGRIRSFTGLGRRKAAEGPEHPVEPGVAGHQRRIRHEPLGDVLDDLGAIDRVLPDRPVGIITYRVPVDPVGEGCNQHHAGQRDQPSGQRQLDCNTIDPAEQSGSHEGESHAGGDAHYQLIQKLR